MVNFFLPDINNQTRLIVEELRALRSSETKLWVPSDLLQRDARLMQTKDVKVVEHGCSYDHSLLCYSWDKQTATVITQFYRDLVAHNIQAPSEKWIIISDAQYPHNLRYLFLDATHLKDYPNAWYKYPCISSVVELIDVLEANHIEPRNVLLDTRYFSLVNDNFKHVRGAQVYREKETGNLFYLDTMHKDHYEVFDSAGKIHLGIANRCKGKLIPGTADLTKLPIL